MIIIHLPLVLAFVAGAVTELLAAKVIARIRAIHPGKTLAQDLETKITSIVDAKLAEAANTNKTA